MVMIALIYTYTRGEWLSMAFSRTHLILLSVLSKLEANSAGKAVTMQYINDYCPIGKSYTTLLRAIQFLHKNELIQQGVKDGQFNTYFITTQGIEKLKEML
jgi:CTP-dependent riboflavin kinase